MAARADRVHRASQARPVRTCVGCKERAAKSDLLRLVVVADDEAAPGVPDAPGTVLYRHVVPDPSGRRLGRGASLHPDLRCLDLAERRRAFPRAFRVPGPLDATAVRIYLESEQVD